MLRGFRWQLLVLVTALGLFIVTLLSRLSPPEQPQPEVVDQTVPTIELAPPTHTPQEEAVVSTPVIVGEAPIVTYREALVGSVQRLNPLLASLNPVDQDISALIFEGLTRINQYGEPEPALAKSWVVSNDGLEYVVELREDVLWQDGIPFTATDVIYTLSLLQSTDFPGDPELGTFWRTVEVQLLNDYLIRFRLTQPLGSFLDALSIGILPEHALRGTTAAQLAQHPFNLSPIGTGAYQLEALRSNTNDQIQMVDLRVAPVYRARPEGNTGYAIERVRFRLFDTFDDALNALRAGEVDAMASGHRSERPALLDVSGLNIYTALKPTLGALIFNWAKDSTRFFREQRVRIALQTGLNRGSVIERHLFNQAVRADSSLFPGSWAYKADLPWPIPNVEAARQMLENARIQPGSSDATEEATSNGNSIQFTILTPNDPGLVNVANEIAAQWSQLNISVSVDVADVATYQARLDSGDFDSALVELSLGDSADPDVYQFWDQGQYPDGKNYGGVDDRRIAEELERARRDPSGINRALHYANFQSEFVERAIAIPLYYPLYTYVTSAQVQGVQLGFMASSTSRFMTIKDWTISASS